MAARSSATPSGMWTLPVKKDTFTDWLFWMMNTRSNTRTTTPTMTTTQTPEIRAGRVEPPAGHGLGVSDAGDASLMTSPPLLDSDHKFMCSTFRRSEEASESSSAPGSVMESERNRCEVYFPLAGDSLLGPGSTPVERQRNIGL